MSVWLFLTTIHLPAFSTLQSRTSYRQKAASQPSLRRPCPSRHSTTNPSQEWPRLASSAAQLPSYCTSTLRRPTLQFSTGQSSKYRWETAPIAFLPQDKFYTWFLSLLNTWTQGLVQPLVSVDGSGYAWHLSNISLCFALRLVDCTLRSSSFHAGFSLGLRSSTQICTLFPLINYSVVHASSCPCLAPLAQSYCPFKHISQSYSWICPVDVTLTSRWSPFFPNFLIVTSYIYDCGLCSRHMHMPLLILDWSCYTQPTA